MSTGSVSDPEEMELRGLQRGYPVPVSKRPSLRGADRSYVSPSDNSSAEEDDPDGEAITTSPTPCPSDWCYLVGIDGQLQD